MKNRVMKNKQDFILKVENEGFFGSLNRFMYKRFDRTTAVWSDCAGSNVLLFVTDGEALFSGGYGDEAACETMLHRKVTILPKGMPFVMEFRPGCEILAYPFDGYMPMDASVYAGIVREAESVAGEMVAADIPKALERELVNICRNIVSIGPNETLTHLAMRKVTALMQRSMKPALTAKLFAIGGSELGDEIFRYMKMVENRTNLTKRSVEVIF